MAKRLFLIGLGLCDEGDLPVRAMDLLRGCHTVFAESYTNLMRDGTLSRLEGKIGRKITLLPREMVEGEKEILEAAKKGETALLVPGDPMTATTHSSLLDSARKEGIEARIVHASSIFTAAAGECGLQIYKFGKTATVTYWRENFRPTSFLDVIAENLRMGAHTLCLLDIDPKMGPMKVGKAIETLLSAQEEGGKKVVGADSRIFAVWHAGWPDMKIWAGKMGEWKKRYDAEGPAAIIILGKMHFAEEENYERVAAARGESGGN